MDKKLILQDLANALATRSKQPKSVVDSFTRAFFETIEEGLERDRFVKIKGWGTFKLTPMGERESININTGERFQIGEHYKISFVPETKLKELINKPFSHFQTIILNDNVALADLDAVNEVVEPVPDTEPSTTEMQNKSMSGPMSENPVESDTTQLNNEATSSFQQAVDEPEEQARTATQVDTDLSFPMSGSQNPDEKISTSEDIIEKESDESFTEEADVTCSSKALSEPAEPVAETETAIPADAADSNSNEDLSVADKISGEGHVHDTESSVVTTEKLAQTGARHTKEPLEVKITALPMAFIRPWYKLFIIICMIIALGLGYLIGFFHLIGPQPKPEIQVRTERVVIKDTVHAIKSPVSLHSTDSSATQHAENASSDKTNERPYKPTVGNHKEKSSLSTPKADKDGVITYKVKRGESLYDISRKFYHSDRYVGLLIRYNRIANPDHIAYDTILRIPPLPKKSQ